MSITVLGECVADAFVQPSVAAGELGLRVLPGGGPANTATALARLGTPTRLLARLSADPFGALFRERLTAAGVDLGDCVAAAESSTLAIAALDANGQAGYSFHAEGTADWQWQPAELAAVDLTGTSAVHTGSLALVRAPGGRVVENFLVRARAHATISIDPNVRPLLVAPERYRERIARWCALADILRLSADDLALLRPGVTAEQACDEWHALGVPLVVLTLGEHGALASLDGVRLHVPAVRTHVVDTVGAGDAFTGALLHCLDRHGLLGGRLAGLTLEHVAEACRFAAEAAALTCAVAGAEPPRADQLGGAGRPAARDLPTDRQKLVR
ncbi:fructokinase [Kitasatospora sp. MAP12-15]|uniref:carbohydrate kinase family protein n=1 Tax=unclassified Kitasatospora TaxID=2633591 RepID=UPI0024731E2E|nr:carbohydrate kinase [Kitasatospora sp. MAP12-44]MDH6113385.1 fructokinase [Kitasatospora sp. MAP12-44]